MAYLGHLPALAPNLGPFLPFRFSLDTPEKGIYIIGAESGTMKNAHTIHPFVNRQPLYL